MSIAFAAALFNTIVSGFHLRLDRNVDPFRFPGRQRSDRIGARTAFRALFALLGASEEAAASVASMEDEESRQLLLDLCAFRVLGGRHYRLGRNDPFFWKCVDSVERELLAERAVSRACGYDLDLYRIPGVNGVLEIECHPMNVLQTFLVEEYRFARSGNVVEVIAGDTVIDGGGCWGDTALYFADRVGSGKVFVFEPEKENLGVLRRNLARNPKLAQRIEIVESALWSSSGAQLNLTVAGPGTKVDQSAAIVTADRVTSVALDDWGRDAAVPRIDFIKMDIEGAETAALEGAKETIRASAPKLAISIYHSIHDLVGIPARLAAFRSDYEVFLSHATIHAEESIAFARPRAGAA